MCFGYGTVRDCGGECVPYLPELHQVVVIAGDSDLCCCVSYFLFKCGVYGAKKTLFSRGGEVTVYVLFCSCVCFILYGPFNCISFHNSPDNSSAFSLCSSGLISALLVLSTINFFMKVSLSPDVILCG